MKKFKIQIILIGLLAITFSSCSDFFEPNNDTILKGEDYIKEGGELYSGFLGIVTKVQAIGDKSIYLTDTRAEVLEPTEGAPAELVSLYNYEDDLTGNTYADPAKYYDVIIACNDYLLKAKDYKDNHLNTIDEDDYKKLISATLRVKAWIYLTLGRIYGQAIWFDDPIQSMNDLADQTPENLDGIINACDKLLNTGFDGVNGTFSSLSWGEWLNPASGATSTSDEYKRWDMMVPGYAPLQAEILLWKGDYEKAAKLLLGEMSKAYDLDEYKGNVAIVKLMRSGSYGTNFGEQYDSQNPVISKTESVIRYDYQYNQQNSLLKHFDQNGSYMLRASVPGVQRFSDVTFNPPSDGTATKTTDRRANAFREVVKDEEYSVRKYRGFSKSGHTVAHDDVYIMIYHTADFYFMAIEALNNMGRYEPASVLMNQGVDIFYLMGVELGEQWQGLNSNWNLWTTNHAGFRRTYADNGVRGVLGLGKRDIWQSSDDINADEEGLEGLTDEQKIRKHNDIELVKEAFLEFPCEGKTYPLMIRVAKRWNDYSIIARFVSEKYPDVAKQEEVKAKIMAGAYFVPWDLKSKASSH
ncbi:hypothetical protein [Bacteroides sp. 224]|uniref:hypothetical protein n=1 Tax=Bacteroides sp. 224 TaxID=2302936 RepID=UPI0013D7FB07|nr:hypothetical protein [Bacteroides sp. 224]NDV63656.1 hypothetical protein [Bacteroides sp. 224]